MMRFPTAGALSAVVLFGLAGAAGAQFVPDVPPPPPGIDLPPPPLNLSPIDVPPALDPATIYTPPSIDPPLGTSPSDSASSPPHDPGADHRAGTTSSAPPPPPPDSPGQPFAWVGSIPWWAYLVAAVVLVLFVAVAVSQGERRRL